MKHHPTLWGRGPDPALPVEEGARAPANRIRRSLEAVDTRLLAPHARSSEGRRESRPHFVLRLEGDAGADVADHVFLELVNRVRCGVVAGDSDREVDVEISRGPPLARHALALQAHDLPTLRARGELRGDGAIDGRDAHLRAVERLRRGHREVEVKIVFFAPEELVLLHVDEEEQISRGASVNEN